MSISNRTLHNLSAPLVSGHMPLADLYAYKRFLWINTPEDVVCIRSLFAREPASAECNRMLRTFRKAAKKRGLSVYLA